MLKVIQEFIKAKPKQTAVIGIVTAVCLFLIGSYIYILTSQVSAANGMVNDKPVYVRVKQGMNADKIAEELYSKGIIDSRFKFRMLAKYNGLDGHLKAGSYTFDSKMTYREIIKALSAGETSAMMVTVPEGYNIDQIGKLLEDKGICSQKEIQMAAKDFAEFDYMLKKNDAKYRAEGFLFPDTYEIANGQSAKDILSMMAKEFDKKFTAEMRQKAGAMNLSIYDVITLAALVEKEAKFDEDRPIIAQVFFKRLQIGMPLQSDTTIQYLLDAPKEDVSIADTKLKSPYNTYQVMGLPPGPIANPGMEAIQAVLNPAGTDYLYFVADRQGHNHYTTNYQEHLIEVDRVR